VPDVTYALFWLSTIISVTGLAVALCLGLYIVTRMPRGWLTWLAALTLWSLASFYLYNALAVTTPNNRALPLLRPGVVFALAFGFNLVLVLPPRRREPGFRFYRPRLRLPEALEEWLGTRAQTVSQLPVPLVYALALILVIVGVFPLSRPRGPVEGPALYLGDRAPSPLYPLTVVYLVILCGLAFWHQWQGWREEADRDRRLHRLALLVAIVLTFCGGLYLSLGVWLQVRMPSFPGDLAVGVAAVFLGYRVARHNALVAGIMLRRELLYIWLAITLFSGFYVAIAEFLHQEGHVFSALTLIVIVIIGVTSLMLYDGMRAALDRLFYRERFRRLRANLRALAREAGVGQSLPERLQAVLGPLCRTLHAKRGLVALRGEDAFECQATERAQCLGQTYDVAALVATEIVELPRPVVRNPEGMSLLVPLQAGDVQIGALVLGPKDTGTSYSEDDLMLLDDVAERLVSIIEATQQQEEDARVLNDLVAQFREREHDLQRQVQQMLAEREEEARPVLDGVDDEALVSMVEDALRRLHDFSYLGQQELAQLRVVDLQLEARENEYVTHIDRGKALSAILTHALNKLRPEDEEPPRHAVPPRKWHQFVTLHDAYVQGELNRDIMSKLYIGEGTFSRTRRHAIRSVAKALEEMEREAQQRGMG
jgi:GAF domain-containing protein